MGVVEQLQAYKARVFNDVSQQIDPESIPPDTVGDIGIDLADILISQLPLINTFTVTAGTAAPSGGGDTDLYFKSNIDSIEVFRNVVGTWQLLATIPLGFNFPNGIINGLRTSILQLTVTVTAGAWSIANNIYSKSTQTQFILDAPDPNYDRFDLIYVNTANQVLLIKGAATLAPVKPNTPANCITVDYAYVPAVGTAYLLAGQVIVASTPDPLNITVDMLVDGKYTLAWTQERINNFGKFGRFAVEQANTYQEAPIKINKNLTTGFPESYEFDLSGIPSFIHIL